MRRRFAAVLKKNFSLEKQVLLLSVIIFFIMTLELFNLGPHFWFDSYKYIFSALEIGKGSPLSTTPPLEVRPGYPLLINFFDYNFKAIILLQCGLAFAGLASIYAISRCTIGRFPAAVSLLLTVIFSGLVVEAGAIMTEVANTSIELVAFYFYMQGINKKNSLLILISVILIGVAGWFRSLGAILWLIPLAFWLLSRWSTRTHRYSAVSTCTLSIVAVAVVLLVQSPMKRNDSSFFDSLGIIWLRTVQYQPDRRDNILERERAYFEDYRSWVQSRERPAFFVSVDPFWKTKDDYKNDYVDWVRSGGDSEIFLSIPLFWEMANSEDVVWKELWRQKKHPFWYKAPLYMRTTYYGETLSEALGWQREVAFRELRENPGGIARSIVKDVYSSFKMPLRIYKRLAGPTESPASESSKHVSSGAYIIGSIAIGFTALDSLGIYFLYPLLAVILAAIMLLKAPSNVLFMILTYVFSEMLISITLAGDLPRYMILFYSFTPMFIIGGSVAFWRHIKSASFFARRPDRT